MLEFPREHNEAEYPEHFPESLFNSSATQSWLYHFLKSPPDVKAGLGIGGLSSRPDTAEKTMLTLAQWKLLYLIGTHQLLLTLEGERQLGRSFCDADSGV